MTIRTTKTNGQTHAEEKRMQSTLSIRIDSKWDEVRHVREQSEGFFRQLGLGASAVEALTMVASELTENAVKYGIPDGERRILVTISRGADAVIVEVKSPMSPAADAAVAKLEAAIQWIRGHQDPFEAYLERVQHASSQQMTSTESGLGLVRIAYEGHSILDFYIDEENMVAVSAVYPLENGAPS